MILGDLGRSWVILGDIGDLRTSSRLSQDYDRIFKLNFKSSTMILMDPSKLYKFDINLVFWAVFEAFAILAVLTLMFVLAVIMLWAVMAVLAVISVLAELTVQAVLAV